MQVRKKKLTLLMQYATIKTVSRELFSLIISKCRVNPKRSFTAIRLPLYLSKFL